MFETALLSTGPQSKRAWTTFVGVTGQALLVVGLVLAPLISPAALPRVIWGVSLAPPPAPLPPPVPVQVQPATHTRFVRANVFTAPTFIPPDVKIVVDDVAEAAPTGPFVPGAVATTGATIGSNTGIIGGLPQVVPGPPPPPPVTTVAAPKTPPTPPRITVLQMAEPIQRVNPIYPQIARTARIGGKVELMGVLGTDGRIHEIKVLSGHPLLVKAAVDAVMQWVYKPTILNGQAVEVQAPITVNFILN
jgi:periplasmic protein TonB